MFNGPHPIPRGVVHATVAHLLVNVIKKVPVPPALAPAVAPLPAILECTVLLPPAPAKAGWDGGANSDPKEYGKK